MTINFNALKEEMPHKWKVQTASAKCISCVAYVDSRQVQDKLDDVVGPQNWQDEYYEIDGQLYCRIGINVGTDDAPKWVWKSVNGELKKVRLTPEEELRMQRKEEAEARAKEEKMKAMFAPKQPTNEAPAAPTNTPPASNPPPDLIEIE